MIGIIYGGDSLEHEVSIKSGKAAAKEIGGKEFYLKKDGTWEVDGEVVKDVIPSLKECEVVMPLIHGSPGEDGILQGFLEMNEIPYIGCDISASAVCMDKDFTKRILESHGVKTTPSQTFYSLEEAVGSDITTPCVVKVTSLGSSFGIYKVTDNLKEALEKAFALSDKVLVEKMVVGRELWCSVLEKEDALIVSSPCEIVPEGGFFYYEDKYSKASKTIYHVPALNIPEEEIKKIVEDTFRFLGCKGMARVDLFLTEEGEILVNEINTIPGFTADSLYPKALRNDGISYNEIISTLIEQSKSKGLKNRSRNLSSSKEGMLV